MWIVKQSCQICFKAFFPTRFGNDMCRSGIKSLVRNPVYSEKQRRAKVIMSRFTKLIRVDGLTLGDKCYITGTGLSMIWVSFSMYWVSLTTIIRRSYLELNTNLNSQRTKITQFEQKGTMGNPVERNFYGFGSFVVDVSRRGLGIRHFSSKQNITPEGSVLLKKLKETNTCAGINEKVIHIIANLEILTAAYKVVEKLTPDTMLDRSQLKFLTKISEELKAGKFKFYSSKQAYILKHNKNEQNSLNFVSLRDNIVQNAILLVLESIFEPTFLSDSHGFRPEKGCHTALKSLKHQFGGIIWAIKGNILNFYDTVNHKILINLIRKRINCDKTISLINRSLKIPYKKNGKIIYRTVGILQDNMLSALFCNIYLHEFDVFLENLKNSFNKGTRRKKNPQYRRLQYLISKKDLDRKKLVSLSKELRTLDSKDPYDSDFRRFHYIRYASEFVIGIIGSRKDCTDIHVRFKDFLDKHLLLMLDLKKPQIFHFNKRGIFFLGTFIKGNQEKEKVVRSVKKNNKTIKMRTTSRTRFTAPLVQILEKAKKNGFYKCKQGKFLPTACRRLVNMDHSDILSFYNQKIHGILDYYSFVDNKKSLGSIVHGFKHSCALTLALKYKLRYRSKVFKKFGKTLKCPETKKELYLPKTFARDQEFNNNPKDPMEILDLRWTNKLTRTNLNKSCLICGAFLSEMHHVKKIRDLKNKYKSNKIDFWTLQLAAINRKQIPLCSKHHIALHCNKLSLDEKLKLTKSLK